MFGKEEKSIKINILQLLFPMVGNCFEGFASTFIFIDIWNEKHKRSREGKQENKHDPFVKCFHFDREFQIVRGVMVAEKVAHSE